MSFPVATTHRSNPNVNEADVAGGLQNTPIPLVRGETVDVDVPASAEIVLKEVLPMSVWSKALSASTWAMKQGNLHPAGY